MRILIVDDYPSGRELAAEALRPVGCELMEADRGDIAIRLARQEQPDLILLDIRMPSLDGFDAIRALRNDPTTANICIVAFTACAMLDERQAAMASGFDGIITKPITMSALRNEVLQYLARIRVARSRNIHCCDAEPQKKQQPACVGQARGKSYDVCAHPASEGHFHGTLRPMPQRDCAHVALLRVTVASR